MDIQKQVAFEKFHARDCNCDYEDLKRRLDRHELLTGHRYPPTSPRHEAWLTWCAAWDAKAQAVQEQDQQVWATSNLTWKDIAFRALSCKVLKSTENWVHVKNIACVGSTTASLICKKLGVNPDGTKFELIEAQEPTND